jgi:hypothetical protein
MFVLIGIQYTWQNKKHTKYCHFAMCNDQGTRQRSHWSCPWSIFCYVQLPQHRVKIQTLMCASPLFAVCISPSTLQRCRDPSSGCPMHLFCRVLEKWHTAKDFFTDACIPWARNTRQRPKNTPQSLCRVPLAHSKLADSRSVCSTESTFACMLQSHPVKSPLSSFPFRMFSMLINSWAQETPRSLLECFNAWRKHWLVTPLMIYIWRRLGTV